MSLQTLDLLSKGDTQKGREKVTSTSVMDVLKWRTGDYRVLVTDAEPMLVPGLTDVLHVTIVQVFKIYLAHAPNKNFVLVDARC